QLAGAARAGMSEVAGRESALVGQTRPSDAAWLCGDVRGGSVLRAGTLVAGGSSDSESLPCDQLVRRQSGRYPGARTQQAAAAIWFLCRPYHRRLRNPVHNLRPRAFGVYELDHCPCNVGDLLPAFDRCLSCDVYDRNLQTLLLQDQPDRAENIACDWQYQGPVASDHSVIRRVLSILRHRRRSS